MVSLNFRIKIVAEALETGKETLAVAWAFQRLLTRIHLFIKIIIVTFPNFYIILRIDLTLLIW